MGAFGQIKKKKKTCSVEYGVLYSSEPFKNYTFNIPIPIKKKFEQKKMGKTLQTINFNLRWKDEKTEKGRQKKKLKRAKETGKRW